MTSNTLEFISKNESWKRFYKKIKTGQSYYANNDEASLDDIAELIDKYELEEYLNDETLPAMLARMVTFDNHKHDGSLAVKENAKYRAVYYATKTSIDLALRMYAYLKHNDITDMTPALTMSYVSYMAYKYSNDNSSLEDLQDIFNVIMNHDYTNDPHSLIEMFPSYDMASVPDKPNAIPNLTNTYVCIMQPYYNLFQKKPDMHTLFKIGYRNLTNITFIESQFPFRAYNLTKRKYYDIIDSLKNDDEVEWFIECMNAIIENKPVINGGITSEWIRNSMQYPAEFVIQNENIMNNGGSAVYNDIAEEALKYATNYNPLLKEAYASMLGLRTDKSRYNAAPSPAMINSNRKVADRILALDPRVFTSYPTSYDNVNKNNNWSYWITQYTGFDLFTSRMHYSQYVFRNECTPRNKVKIAEQALKTNDTAYRWAVINCMFKFFSRIIIRNSGIYKKYIKSTDIGNTVSNISIPKELKDYMRGKPMPSSFVQKTQSGFLTITPPEPLITTMNQMPTHIDELPSDKTGYELFCLLLKQNIDKYIKTHNALDEFDVQMADYYEVYINNA